MEMPWRMPSRPALLSNFPLLKTSDPELARERFAFLGLERLEVPRSENRFGVRVNHLQMTGIGLSYCAFSSDVSLEFRQASFIRQILPTSTVPVDMQPAGTPARFRGDHGLR